MIEITVSPGIEITFLLFKKYHERHTKTSQKIFTLQTN